MMREGEEKSRKARMSPVVIKITLRTAVVIQIIADVRPFMWL
jgi:hypothetical protein